MEENRTTQPVYGYNFDPKTGEPLRKPLNMPAVNAAEPPEEPLFKTAQYAPPPKSFFSLGKKDYIMVVCSLVLSIVGVSLTLWGGFNLGFTVTHFALFALATAYLFNRSTAIKPYALCCGVLSLLGSCVYAVSLNGSVNFWLVLVVFALTVVWLDSLTAPRSEVGDMGFLCNILKSTFGTAFPNLAKTLRSVFGARKNGALKAVLVGIACALPVLLVVIPLLINSDAAFEGLMQKLFGDIAEMLFKVILGVTLTPFLVSYCFGLAKKNKSEPKSFNGMNLNGIAVASFLSAISLCYLTYLFSQLAYFFDAFKGILPQEFKVAEYARRGFFEMSVIAAINFAIVFFALIAVCKKSGNTPILVKLFSAFICVFTLAVAGTSVAKLMLYISSFGMTRLRILTTAFVVGLAVVFVALFFRCFIKGVRVLRVALVSAAVVLMALGFVNVDRLVAAYNVTAYQKNALEEIDVENIYDMGESGAEYLIKLTKSKDKDVADDAKMYVQWLMEDLYDEEYDDDGNLTLKRKYNDFGCWNYSRSRAYAAFDKANIKFEKSELPELTDDYYSNDSEDDYYDNDSDYELYDGYYFKDGEQVF